MSDFDLMAAQCPRATPQEFETQFCRTSGNWEFVGKAIQGPVPYQPASRSWEPYQPVGLQVLQHVYCSYGWLYAQGLAG